jgi:hypothetical protein
MKDITLYKYKREDGGIDVSPNKPNCEYTTLHRLIADEGMVLVNGELSASVIDVDSVDGWQEVEIQEET